MKIAKFKTEGIKQIVQNNVVQLCYSHQQYNLVFQPVRHVTVFVIHLSPFAQSAVLNHQGSIRVPATTPEHGSRQARAKPGTSYSARRTEACPMENVETRDYLRWNLQYFEKAISQFAKKRRHVKNYQLATWRLDKLCGSVI